ncbi:hypothetical protein [Pseudodesulfovibrio pelocollis]|uniref:hypothetical protein n=1 Tax=Pseudodesulfovibrio pelocollis TaxID=3051432 RepID=UPI00255A885C|nr:hypothetical protein [Pseudodesulfovibrio sp. SB368]
MAKTGTCECCNRKDMTLPAMGLCGRCYAGKNSGRIFWSEEHQLWLARIEADADRFNCVWMGDPALLGPEEFAPTGDGEFAQAGAVDPDMETEQMERQYLHEGGQGDNGQPGPGEAEAAGLDLLAGFEAYQRLAPVPTVPSLTVHRSGKIYFSRSAMRELLPEGATHVRLHYNRETGQMALELLLAPAEGALRLSPTRSGDLCFHGRGFFRVMDIRPRLCRPCPLTALRPGLLVARMEMEPDAGQGAGQDADRIEGDAA